MGNTIYASFDNQANAEKAVGALLDNGVRQEDISVVRSHSETTEYAPVANGNTYGEETSNTAVYERQPAGDFIEQNAIESGTRENYTTDAVTGDDVAYRAAAAHSTGVYADESNLDVTDRNLVDFDGRPPVQNRPAEGSNTENLDNIEVAAKHGLSTTTPADAGKGAIKGTEWGLGIGIVAALATLFVPGVGLVIGGGALAAGIGAAAATAGAGAASGAITGYLKDQGMDEAVAQRYSDSVNRGGAMIAVTIPSGKVDEVRATEILNKYGSSNVNSWIGRQPSVSSTGSYVS